jgi:hypothetical protein
MNGLIIKILKFKHAPIPPTYSQNLRGLIDRLLQKQPVMRPSAGEILRLPFLRPFITAEEPTQSSRTPFATCGPQAFPKLTVPNLSTTARNQKKQEEKIAATNQLSREEMARRREFRDKKAEEERRAAERADAQRRVLEERSRAHAAERSEWMKHLKTEAAERQRKFENLEAPFKKVMISRAKAKSEASGVAVLPPLEPLADPASARPRPRPKPPPLPEPEREVLSLRDVMARGRAERKKQEKLEADRLAEEEAETESAPPPDAMRQFAVDGRVLELPNATDAASRNYRTEKMRKFSEEGLGVDKFVEIYEFVNEGMKDVPDDEADMRMREILSTPAQKEYFPLVQQLVASEID